MYASNSKAVENIHSTLLQTTAPCSKINGPKKENDVPPLKTSLYLFITMCGYFQQAIYEIY